MKKTAAAAAALAPTRAKSTSERVPGEKISARDKELIDTKKVMPCGADDCAVGDLVMIERSAPAGQPKPITYGKVGISNGTTRIPLGGKIILVEKNSCKPFEGSTVYKLEQKWVKPAKKKTAAAEPAAPAGKKRKAQEAIDLTDDNDDAGDKAPGEPSDHVDKKSRQDLGKKFAHVGDDDDTPPVDYVDDAQPPKSGAAAFAPGDSRPEAKLETKTVGLNFTLEFLAEQVFDTECLEHAVATTIPALKGAFHAPIFSFDDVNKQLETFFDCAARDLFDKHQWFGPKIVDMSVIVNTTKKLSKPYTNTFIERCNLDNLARENYEVISVGDIHGSIHSLVRSSFLVWKHLGYIDNNFKIIKPNMKFVFTGDIPDRGRYGIEAFMLLLRFKLANWSDVHILRGNHETAVISDVYGFRSELLSKYGDNRHTEGLCNKFHRLYELLPLGLFMPVGLDKDGNTVYRFFAHGGPSFLHDPRPFLNSRARYSFLGDVDEKYIEQLIEHSIIADAPDVIIRTYRVDKDRVVRVPADATNWMDIHQRLHENPATCFVFNNERKCGHKVDITGLHRYWSFLNKNEYGIRFCGLVRGHDDKDRVCKLLFRDPVQARAVGLVRLPHTTTGQQDWKSVVTPEDLASAPEHGIPLVGRHAPVYTMSTATEGQSVPYEGFIRIIVTRNVTDGRFFVYEREPLRHERSDMLNTMIKTSVESVGFGPVARATAERAAPAESPAAPTHDASDGFCSIM